MLRVVLTFFAVYLLTLPYLKLVGAALLLWIGVGLLKGDDGEEDLEGHSSLAAAIKTIVVADLVMSLDNVVGVAAAAKGNVPLLVFGLVDQHPADHLRQHAHPEADGPLPDHHHARRRRCSAGWPAKWR